MAGNDVFLYSVPTDADSDDVRLRDPTASGTPAGANFAGTATIVFSQTGTLRAASNFAGSTSLTFTQSGALRAPATFAGATTVTFTPTGDFVAGAVAGGAVFAGTSTITFDATGYFTAGLTAGEILQGGGGGHWHGRFRQPKEEEPEKPQLEIVKIGEGTPHEVITGLVVPKIKVRPSRLAHLEALSSGQFDAEKLRSEQKRRLQLADDEWFMMN